MAEINKKRILLSIRRRSLLIGMIPYNFYLIFLKSKQIGSFYRLRKYFFTNYDIICKKDISEFVTRHWNDLNKEYEDYLRMKGIPFGFLRDKVIGYTMFASSGGAAMDIELDFLEKSHPKEELNRILAEEAVGLPIILNRKYRTSHNSIHHFYHLSRFLHSTGADPDSLRTVIEWGGGYGNFAKIFLRHGKFPEKITYVIIDTPLFSCIQWLYLSVVLGEQKINFIKKEEDHIVPGKVNIVPLGFVEKINIQADLFVSTWALSESSVFSQDYVLDRDFFGAKNILISYQQGNSSLPDADRINSIIRQKRENIINEEIKFLPGSNYLFN